MKQMRVYTVLNASLPPGLRSDWSQTRLWIVSETKRTAIAPLQELGISWRVDTFAGPVRPGNFLNALRGLGMLSEPAVFAYPIPWLAATPVVQIRSRTSLKNRALMGDIFAGS